jgi:cell division protein ZapA
MGGSPVELTVGGQTYRVVATAEEPVLQRLANVVDAKLRKLSGPGRPIAPQAMLLAAMTLAHELEEERARRREVERKAREMLTNVLERIDNALEEAEAAARPGSAAPQESTDSPEPTRPDNPPVPLLDG